MFLFFDTETTGLIQIKKGVSVIPQIVQLAYILSDDKGNILEQNEFIIRPISYEIPIESTRIHNISTEKAVQEGVELEEVLENFSKVLSKAKVIVAHNLNFDEVVVEAAYKSIGLTNPFEGKIRICTLNNVKVKRCFPFFRKLKKSKLSLSNLHLKLLGKKLNNAHNASNDTLALYNCFWVLLKNKQLDLINNYNLHKC